MNTLIFTLSFLSATSFAADPVPPVRMATVRGSITKYIYDRTADGMLYSKSEKVCDFEKEVGLYDMRQPNDASFAKVADCVSTKDGQAVQVKVNALFRIDQEQGKPAFKEGVGFLISQAPGSEDINPSWVTGSGASSEDLTVKNLTVKVNYGNMGGSKLPAHEEAFSAEVSYYDLNQ